MSDQDLGKIFCTEVDLTPVYGTHMSLSVQRGKTGVLFCPEGPRTRGGQSVQGTETTGLVRGSCLEGDLMV